MPKALVKEVYEFTKKAFLFLGAVVSVVVIPTVVPPVAVVPILSLVSSLTILSIVTVVSSSVLGRILARIASDTVVISVARRGRRVLRLCITLSRNDIVPLRALNQLF